MWRVASRRVGQRDRTKKLLYRDLLRCESSLSSRWKSISGENGRSSKDHCGAHMSGEIWADIRFSAFDVHCESVGAAAHQTPTDHHKRPDWRDLVLTTSNPLSSLSSASSAVMPSDISTWLIAVPQNGDSVGLQQELSSKLEQARVLPRSNIAELNIPSLKVRISPFSDPAPVYHFSYYFLAESRPGPWTSLSPSRKSCQSMIPSLPLPLQRLSTPFAIFSTTTRND